MPDPIDLNSAEGEKADSDEPGAKRARLDLSSVSGTKVMALPNGRVHCNTPICDLIKVVKPVIRALVEDSNLLKMWISFMIPKIEDGNNFGVSIQEDTLAEIQSVETEAAAFFDQISRYFVSRAKVVSKVAKYPHIDDYRRAVQVRLMVVHMSVQTNIKSMVSVPLPAGTGREGIPQLMARVEWGEKSLLLATRHRHKEHGEVEKATVVQRWKFVLIKFNVNLCCGSNTYQNQQQDKSPSRKLSAIHSPVHIRTPATSSMPSDIAQKQ